MIIFAFSFSDIIFIIINHITTGCINWNEKHWFRLEVEEEEEEEEEKKAFPTCLTFMFFLIQMNCFYMF